MTDGPFAVQICRGCMVDLKKKNPYWPQLGLFHPYFVCKSSFRVISMIKMVILDQSKPISLYLKIKISRFD